MTCVAFPRRVWVREVAVTFVVTFRRTAIDSASLRYTVLCCAVLCCAMLCFAALYCAALCCVVLCCAMLCCTMLYYAVLCCNVLCCVVLCCVVLRCAALFCVVLRCAVSSAVSEKWFRDLNSQNKFSRQRQNKIFRCVQKTCILLLTIKSHAIPITYTSK